MKQQERPHRQKLLFRFRTVPEPLRSRVLKEPPRVPEAIPLKSYRRRKVRERCRRRSREFEQRSLIHSSFPCRGRLCCYCIEEADATTRDDLPRRGHKAVAPPPPELHCSIRRRTSQSDRH